MISAHDTLSAPQRTALDALATGASVTDAAKAAGVTRQTVSFWRNRNPDFMAALNAVARDNLANIGYRALHLAPLALGSLESDLNAGGPEGRQAARDLLAFIRGLPEPGPANPDAVRAEILSSGDVDFLLSLPDLTAENEPTAQEPA